MRIKYLLDFGDEPTLLICADRIELHSLSERFSRLAERIRLDSVFAKTASIQVTARLADSDQGLKFVRENDGFKEFSWTLTAAKWKEFSDRTRVLAESESAAHQYLEGIDDDATVIASSEDYGDLFDRSDITSD